MTSKVPLVATPVPTGAQKRSRRTENKQLALQLRAEAFPDLFLGCSGNTCFGLEGAILTVVSETGPVPTALQQPHGAGHFPIVLITRPSGALYLEVFSPQPMRIVSFFGNFDICFLLVILSILRSYEKFYPLTTL